MVSGRLIHTSLPLGLEVEPVLFDALLELPLCCEPPIELATAQGDRVDLRLMLAQSAEIVGDEPARELSATEQVRD